MEIVKRESVNKNLGGEKKKKMKTKTKTIATVEIAIVLCSVFLVAIPAIAAEQNQEMQKVSASEVTTASKDDYVLGVYGNANEDDTIDMRDLTYVKLIFFGKKPETELADAKYDGKINPLDFIQIKLIIVGKEKEITLLDTLSYREPDSERIVTVKKPVKRILFYNYGIEVMRSLKAQDKLVGVDVHVVDSKAFYPELSKLPSAGSFWNPDYEAILNLEPDLIITYAMLGGRFDKDKVPGVTVVCLDFDMMYPMLEEVRKLGYVLGKREEAENLVDFYRQEEINDRLAGLSDEEKPKVFVEVYRKYSTSTDRWFWGQAVASAGGINLAAEFPGLSQKVDPEWVIEQNPEVIVRIIGSAAGKAYGSSYEMDDPILMKQTREEIMNRPELANVAAVKNGRVYVLPVDLGQASYPMTIAYMLKWFHPDLFKDLDPEAIHQEYLTRFQGLDYDLDEHGVFAYPPIEIDGCLAGIPDRYKGEI